MISYQLTTDHPQSSYGCPVFVRDGKVYGAMDVVAETFLGEPKTAADIVAFDLYEVSGPKVDPALAKAFLSNSPLHNRDAMLADADKLEAGGGVFGPIAAEAIRSVWRKGESK